jgi:hypothetical protein
MCHADSHLDCDGRLHVGNSWCASGFAQNAGFDAVRHGRSGLTTANGSGYAMATALIADDAPPSTGTLAVLRAAEAHCTRCPLYRCIRSTVTAEKGQVV